MYLFLAIEQTYWVIKMFASHKGVFDDSWVKFTNFLVQVANPS